MPVQRGLLPSMISRHLSLASGSVHLDGRRYASRVRMAPTGDAGGAGGINLTNLERMSPVRTS